MFWRRRIEELWRRRIEELERDVSTLFRERNAREKEEKLAKAKAVVFREPPSDIARSYYPACDATTGDKVYIQFKEKVPDFYFEPGGFWKALQSPPLDPLPTSKSAEQTKTTNKPKRKR